MPAGPVYDTEASAEKQLFRLAVPSEGGGLFWHLCEDQDKGDRQKPGDTDGNAGKRTLGFTEFDRL